MSDIVYIDAPEVLTRRQRTFGALITALMWAVYCYLWLPLVSLLAWGLGIELAYEAVVKAGGAGALRTAAFWYAVMLGDVVVTVALWSLINKWRFAGHNRRTAHEQVPDTELADHFGVTAQDLARLRTARRLELDVDAFGRPVLPGSAARGGAGSLISAA
jgi:poly-beta-1,6-N-acetyl-D-glucosamine biosynthesis protein PgaD